MARTLRSVVWVMVGGVLLTACSGLEGAGVRDLLAATGLAGSAPLDEGTIVAGLKEALRVGTRNAVASTSRPDGFLANPRIHIPLPEELETMARGLRRVGLGRQVDELELAMNRAAEEASAEAFSVFASAVTQMSFADARGILGGGETAATDYFQRTTRDELGRRFAPIVARTMESVGLARLYDDLMARWRAIPLAPDPGLDLRAYVTERGLSGLFTVLADEERRIRADPAARTTELLRRVFGGAAS